MIAEEEVVPVLGSNLLESTFPTISTEAVNSKEEETTQTSWVKWGDSRLLLHLSFKSETFQEQTSQMHIFQTWCHHLSWVIWSPEVSSKLRCEYTQDTFRVLYVATISILTLTKTWQLSIFLKRVQMDFIVQFVLSLRHTSVDTWCHEELWRGCLLSLFLW